MRQRKFTQRKFIGNQYGSLESRNLLASITLSGGELVLGGGPDVDIASVSISGTTLTAQLTGAETETFSASAVDSILFVALGGDDQFTN